MQRDKLRLLAVITPALLFTGCARPVADPSLAGVEAYIDQQTAFTVDNKAYAARYGALASTNPNAVDVVPSAIQNEWLLLVDGNFNGTVEDLTKKMAALLDYRVAADGEKPPSPIFVAVHQYNLSAIGLLREGFAQARTRATLTVDQFNRVLTVHYLRPEQSPVPHQDDVIL
ncbi:MAG: DotD/TraH family lipoprotein [Fulvimarina manganoxydans]|uniref:DotD/TraH family lipoprotein n=1 Tax=Fulvimarina manganoxydans TaxID=937218 RepID=UPI0023523DA8|nr:DotD/TraH family lipoprotein [Fulvimarina manganoxydans]MCK5934048.1 DotD/TraH family lipoprotein [Fulvimarina manganoxydans]